jgi:hypothetical protein
VEDARTIGFTFASDAPLAIALATVRSRWRDLVGTAGATGIGPRRLRSTPAAGTAPLRLEEQPAATGDVAAPSQMEQSTEVAGGPSQLVRSDRLFGLLPGRSLRFAKR